MPTRQRRPNRLLTVPQAANTCHVSRWTIYEWIRNGRLQAVRLGGKLIRINISDLQRMLDANRAVPASRRPRPAAAHGASEPQPTAPAPAASEHVSPDTSHAVRFLRTFAEALLMVLPKEVVRKQHQPGAPQAAIVPTPAPGRYLTPEQAAKALTVTAWTIRQWIRSGKLPAAKVGRRLRIDAQDVELCQSLAAVERTHIKRVLTHTNRDMTRAARILGISRETLRIKLRAMTITRKRITPTAKEA